MYHMRLSAQAFWLPKAGHRHEEYEDAFAPRRLSKGEVAYKGKSFACAIADGATEASFSAYWAQLLTMAYAHRRLQPERLEHDLSSLQEQWRRWVSCRPLPWYAEEKVKMGAFASLLGLSLSIHIAETRQVGKFSVIAVGDSCIFQVRSNSVIFHFPLQASEQFNNRPVLLSSLARHNTPALQAACLHEGEWRSEDRFLLMTDALACWFLHAWEQGDPSWQKLLDLGICDGEASFADWITHLRDRGSLKNDDVTLLRIEMA
jgi:hypothetical protein